MSNVKSKTSLSSNDGPDGTLPLRDISVDQFLAEDKRQLDLL